MKLQASPAQISAMQKRQPRTTLHDRLLEQTARRQEPQEPTKERAARAPYGYAVGSHTRAHTERTPLDLYAKDLKPEHITAAQWYIELASMANAALSASAANYNGIRSASFGPGQGGVGDGQRDDFQSYVDLRESLTSEEIAALDALVAEARDGHLMSAAAFGATRLATLIDHSTRKGFGIAAMFYSLERVVEWRKANRRKSMMGHNRR